MPNITLEQGVAVDLYAATGITTGTKISVQNITGSRVKVAVSQAALSDDYRVIDQNQTAVNDGLDAGAWAMSATGYCEINVRAEQ